MKYLIVLTACSSVKEARKLAALLLNKRFCACVQISSPMESHYRWKGKLEKSKEVLLSIKTNNSLYPQIEKLIRSMHSYSLPEIIAVPFSKGSKAYLAWVDFEVKRPLIERG